MTLKELTDLRNAIQQECNEKQWMLCFQYARDHNPIKVGDIIADRFRTIKVEKMTYAVDRCPYMVFRGVECTKKGVPKKHQPSVKLGMHQVSVCSINGTPYKYEEDNG